MRIAIGLVVLVFLPALAWSDTPPEAKKAAIEYLRDQQNDDGGFCATAARGPSTLGATSSAIRAIRYLGGEIPHTAEVRKFVEKCYDPASGGFADIPGGKTDVRSTAIGAMALAELGALPEPFKEKVTKYLSENARDYEGIRIAVAGLEALKTTTPKAAEWQKQIEGMASTAGIWGKDDGIARDTGGSAVILLRLGVKLKDETLVIKMLDAGLRPDGGYGKADTKASDLETTYRVMRCYHMLKKQPAGADQIRKFVASCQNKDGGFGTAPGQASSVSGTYFASVINKWLDGK
jgi:prenyltransferase beta subunit